ncbi:hypothetical protein [Alienimonas californiensis]|uniref:Uncharacterized protein n=1 Tax=Alienimonas californiensis TaxID=2527989 RepID=A0A517PDW2_9PLAN|nr:hypothetical protein [Alienimonas californiensis]QDT17573.1 hypothetical protein CA12_37010 [Alienimonas californiensis]
MLRPLTLPVAALLGVVLSGCSTLTVPVAEALPSWMPGQPERGLTRATKQNPVAQVAGFWQPAEDTGPNGRPVRGFAGKILLFPAASRGDEPMAGRGAVRVSLYDQTGESDVLIHQYDLPPDAWETHLAHSNLGVGYEVFLPYLSPDPRKIRCGLRIQFVPEYEDGTTGRPVFSAMESCCLDDAGTSRRTGASAEVVANRHGLRTETIRPVAVVKTVGPPASASGVVPASAEDPSGGVQTAAATATDGLNPEMRARFEDALANAKRRQALSERSAASAFAPASAGQRSATPPAAARPTVVESASPRRFTLTPAEGTAAEASGTNPEEPASHPLTGG